MLQLNALPFRTTRFRIAGATASALELCLPAGMSDVEIERLSGIISQRRKIKKGNAVFRFGDPLRSLYAIHLGSFKTTVVSLNGREQVTGFRGAGELLGLDAISGDRHCCNAIALEDSEVRPIPFVQLERLAHELPALQHNLNKLLSGEIVRDHSMLLLLGNMNSDERLAAFLLGLSQRLEARGLCSQSFVLPMKREEIASYLGLRLETICRGIAHLRDSGLIHLSGRTVQILDQPGLTRLVDGEGPGEAP